MNSELCSIANYRKIWKQNLFLKAVSLGYIHQSMQVLDWGWLDFALSS